MVGDASAADGAIGDDWATKYKRMRIYGPPWRTFGREVDPNRLIGYAAFKMEGHHCHQGTGETWRSDVVADIAKMMLKTSRYKKVNDKIISNVLDIIKFYENARALTDG